MNRKRLYLLAGIVAFARPAIPPAVPNTVSPCMAADRYSAEQIQGIRQIVGATDTNSVRFRSGAGIQIVADSAVELVTDAVACGRAIATFNAGVRAPHPATAVYLIRIGTR